MLGSGPKNDLERMLRDHFLEHVPKALREEFLPCDTNQEVLESWCVASEIDLINERKAEVEDPKKLDKSSLSQISANSKTSRIKVVSKI